MAAQETVALLERVQIPLATPKNFNVFFLATFLSLCLGLFTLFDVMTQRFTPALPLMSPAA